MSKLFSKSSICLSIIMLLLTMASCKDDNGRGDGPSGEPMLWKVESNSNTEVVTVEIRQQKNKSDNVVVNVSPKGGKVMLTCTSGRNICFVSADPNENGAIKLDAHEVTADFMKAYISKQFLTLDFPDMQSAPADIDVKFIVSDVVAATESVIQIRRNK